jgi:cyclic beta-1,2-glucan synthetase
MTHTSEAQPVLTAAPPDPFFPHCHDSEPIRAELFGTERLESHARQLAAAASVTRVTAGQPLLSDFRRNSRALFRAHRSIHEAYRRGERFDSEAEWVLDNFHIIGDALAEIRTDLPRGYYKLLPKLASGQLAGFPRVYALALELVAHCDSCLDEANITRFVQAYQTVTPLAIGEVWAVPIMLRLVLIDNLRRLAEQVVESHHHRREAKACASDLLATQARGRTAHVLASLPTRRRQTTDQFLVHLLDFLHEDRTARALGIDWLEEILAQRGDAPANLIRREQQRQATNQVSIGNCVTSLRLLSALDWTTFFERTSLAEALLRQDPTGVYAQQDFPTRDCYRRVVEQLARGSRKSESEVVQQVLALANRVEREARSGEREARSAERGDADGGVPSADSAEGSHSLLRASHSAPPQAHIGFYLIGQGREKLEAALDYRPTWHGRLQQMLAARPQAAYFGGLGIVTAAILTGVIAYSVGQRTVGSTVVWCVVVLLAALFAASELAIGLVNYLLTLVVSPRVLPKMAFKEGVPPECATFAVMPCMLVHPDSAALLVQRLEIHYLSNPDPQLRFALLTDFADAPHEHMPEDDGFVRAAIEGIKTLNERYCPGKPERFFLCHRRRVWNAVQNCWMGWERKRGKLMEFNRLLRGDTETHFAVISGGLDRLPRIRYVITLDADTHLPQEVGRRLIATLAHPLNQARFDSEQRRVVSGYGVLQPRVSIALTETTKSLFARIYAGSAGLDPYTTAVSDTYQDLFGLGSFTGKGIYDVDAFDAAAGHTFPDNHILSHDLIEGNYARCGLVTDIELLDAFPSLYGAYALREHRWARGDWQLLPWLFRTVPAPGGGTRPNPLPAVERWKILDNLRRSLMPAALLVLLILGWLVLPGPSWFWTGLVFLVLAWPLCIQIVTGGIGLVRELFRQFRFRNPLRDIWPTAAQALLSTIFLADQSRLMIDAIVRTILRLGITRRNLLEWETAAATERRLETRLMAICRSMWLSPVLAVFVGWAVWFVRPNALPASVPLLAAWCVSPVVAFWISRPRRVAELALTLEERLQLHSLARKIWNFFETFVGEEDHWLPPDNYQEDPKGQLAHRTSPTNIGLYFLSCLAAHDFGYLSLPALLDRLEKTFDTLDQLERFHGHFYNWYDTSNLRSLPPGYISTVDSGNLLGCLVALRRGLEEKSREPVSTLSVRAGLADVLQLITQAFRDLELPGTVSEPEVVRDLGAALEQAARLLSDGPVSPSQTLRDSVPAFPHRAISEGAVDASRDAPSRSPTADLLDEEDWLPSLQRKASEMMEHVRHLSAAIHDNPDELEHWIECFAAQLTDRQEELAGASSKAGQLQVRCRRLAQRAQAFAREMDFKILYNEGRHLFSIGYNLSLGKLDNAHYDLLASEARLTSYLAIARGDAPKRHWFQLGRPLTRAGGGLALLSWGGTMFEYLMPRLLLRSFAGTLLDESDRAAVACQVQYGRKAHVPWGISESAYNSLDADLNYQYQAFGVPVLGLKRGLARDLVVAPYAGILALAVCPHLVARNLMRLTHEGAESTFGYFEAIDFTRERLESGQHAAIVKCFMAHHQGMSLLALANCLLQDIMPRRLHSDPMVRAAELLLQERVPQELPLAQPAREEPSYPPPAQDTLHLLSRRLTTPFTAQPRVHLLSGGDYSVMITNSGSGRSVCRGLDMTRWREDRTCDKWGSFFYLRDLRTGAAWSAGYQPIRSEPDEYEVIFSNDKAEFRRLDGGIETHLEMAVSPENPAEIRRLTLTNHSSRSREIEVTSYVEVVLNPHPADLAHPAFGKLFLETEFVAAHEALLCHRRPRTSEEKPVWAVHVVAVDGPTIGAIQYETDRARFLGRGRTPDHPAALDPGARLAGTIGSVLDPILSLRRRLRIAPGRSLTIAFTTALADSREAALARADQYHTFHGITRAFELAFAHSQVELHHLHLSGEEAHLYQRLAAHVVYAGSALRAPSRIVSANHQGQSALWRYGISGDHPIVLVRIGDKEQLSLVRQLLAAHAYWRLKGLEADLVVLNEQQTSYLEELNEELHNLVRGSDNRTLLDKPGGVFLRKAALMPQDDQILLQAAARCILAGDQGSLTDQIEGIERPVPPREPETRRSARETEQEQLPGLDGAWSDLHFDNGIGGFRMDPSEYVLRLSAQEHSSAEGGARSGAENQSAPRFALRASHSNRLPPAPWINVVANPTVGFLVSEGGLGCTWVANSQTNRLTPWSNDPVSDAPSEAVYLRDQVTGEVWSPTPSPASARAPYVVRHGHGYTIFEHRSHGLTQELLVLVPPEDPIKLIALKVRNSSQRSKHLSATYYAEWVLGTVRDQAPQQVLTELDPATGAILARNPFNADFPDRVAFADVGLRPRTFTADRTEFLGRNGSLAAPVGLENELSGTVEANLDPCAVLQVRLDLKPGEEKTVIFLLGQAGTLVEARQLLRTYREPEQVEKTLRQVKDRWRKLLTAVEVRTPNQALDAMLNRWLLYQVLSCRFWGRTAFYQSSGAYGFRDQLQDVQALVWAAPQITRQHILYSASRQFREGDVQHWWHPPRGAGVRTRISDDFLWLPFVVLHYLKTTGDRSILEEPVPFLQAPLLQPNQNDDYRVPEVSDQTGTLYEHCVRAVEHGLRFGAHSLPLMGTGDWNDGMNRVGAGGKGESVWNGWFLLTILPAFAALAEERCEAERARTYREHTERLRTAVEEQAWDGQWYRRAYFDDGTPLGSAQNEECRIDSLTQSWAVISGRTASQHARQAMAAADEHLVRQADKLILLFTPPFNRSTLEPGYVKGYVPGIRENGGQYTHAATWVVDAFARLGQGTRALELFDLLNPIHHSSSPEDVERYRVEPYVLAGDVYSDGPHTGRGGWTWYSGSAGWLYRVGLESILGFHREGSKLTVSPCIPRHWPGFEITYRYRSATYRIRVENPDGVESGVKKVTLDGKEVEGDLLMSDDRQTHEIRVWMG